MYGGLFIARMYGLDYVMGRTVAWLAGAATVAAPILAKARTILGRIKDFQRSIDTELQRNREAKQRELTADADAKRTEVVALQMQLKHSRDELGTLNEELRGLQATQQMVNFIRQRDASTDYRSQLGVIARAHQDFRRLSELMEQVHTQAVSPGGSEEGARAIPSIDRIVLYIDDLDRCPEDKVVDVLQAVHLLLAFPLFVVVVGVDPRWLLHSLKQHSKAFELEDGDQNRQPDGEDAHWRSTPLNYLEKIFQIPYTLTPMQKTGFDRLIDDLATPALAGSALPSPTPPIAPIPPPVVTGVPGQAPGTVFSAAPSPGGSLPAGIAAPPPPPTLPFDLNPDALELTDSELDFMKNLSISSPRRERPSASSTSIASSARHWTMRVLSTPSCVMRSISACRSSWP